MLAQRLWRWPNVKQYCLNESSLSSIRQSTIRCHLGGKTTAASFVFSDGPTFPANTRHWPNVVLMLGRRRRRRYNIKIALGQCLVFARLVDIGSASSQRLDRWVSYTACQNASILEKHNALADIILHRPIRRVVGAGNGSCNLRRRWHCWQCACSRASAEEAGCRRRAAGPPAMITRSVVLVLPHSQSSLCSEKIHPRDSMLDNLQRNTQADRQSDRYIGRQKESLCTVDNRERGARWRTP